MPQIDAQHQGPLVNVASWITLAAMILFTAGKVATKWEMVQKLQNDDFLILLATLTAVGQCVSAAVQVQSGLGKAENTLNKEQYDLYEKSNYVSQIFYVLTIYIAKMAALQFLLILALPNGLNKPDLRRVTVKSTIIFILTWLAIAVLCVIFQCAVPQPWDHASGRCFNGLAFWIANGVIDVTTQLLIGLAPITIPLTVLRLVFLYTAYHSSHTKISSFHTALVTVIYTNYCIIASCLPFLKPLVDSLAVGLMTNDIRVPIRSEDSINDKDKFNPFAILSGRNGFKARNAYGWTRSPTSEYTSTVTAGRDNDVEFRDLERYGSRDRMVINQTKTTVVSSDPRVPGL
ncbi:hypothetical protein MMC28_002659 [Mycoblastus sanguinarius]|nr:hypothetical protein [Mycoblastus sanguinarius]